MLHALSTGFLLSISQIAVIGMQNVLVLNHGTRGKPILALCLACSLCDIAMISLGIFGVNTILFSNPEHIKLFQRFGAIFLLFYGSKLLNNAVTKNHSLNTVNQKHKSNNIVWAVLLVSIINPQAWLDCIVVIGAMSTKYQDINKISFAIGCMLASVIWFFSLGYFSKKIAHIFHKPITWKILDFTMAFLMFGLAYNLVA